MGGKIRYYTNLFLYAIRGLELNRNWNLMTSWRSPTANPEFVISSYVWLENRLRVHVMELLTQATTLLIFGIDFTTSFTVQDMYMSN